MGRPPPLGTPTDAALYLRLFGEFDNERYESRVVMAAITRLGAPALAFRGFARARRRSWASARADFEAALARARSPLLTWVCGAGLVGVHAYDRGVAALRRAAAEANQPRDPLGVRLRARKLAIELSTALGWIHEARSTREQLAADQFAVRSLRAHSLALRRRAASRERIARACEGPPELAATRAYALLAREGPAAAAAALSTLDARAPNTLEVTRAILRLALIEGRLDDFAARFETLAPPDQRALAAERAAWEHARGALSPASFDAETDSDDPRLLYFRGLALTATAGPREAVAALDRARVDAPDSLTLAIAIAIAHHERDPETPDEGIEHRFTELRERAPALLSDAAELCGQPLWADRDTELERPGKLALLRQAQAMLTAERDLELTSYRAPTRCGDDPPALRHVPTRRPGPTHLARLQPTLDATLERHEDILIWALGIEPEARTEPRARPRPPDADANQAWTPRALTPAQIEQFLTDGFIVIPRALDPSFAREVRETAVAQVRAAPETSVRGYDPDDPGRSLRDFDPTAPETWTWERMDVVGPDWWDIEAVAPAAWAAICDLLGGPSRIATRVWGNFLMLSLRCLEPTERVEPAPSAPSWHIDDPPPTTRLDNIRNGLVCIALFDDLASRSGNTWLAPESVALVARELAAHPEGVDFIARRGADITTRCQRFVELTGETGDVILMHPLLMHSASNNPSDRIRWMANPMVYLRAPLDPRRPAAARSPVEEAIARALSN